MSDPIWVERINFESDLGDLSRYVSACTVCEMFQMKKTVDCLSRFVIPLNQEKSVQSTAENSKIENFDPICRDYFSAEKNTSKFYQKSNLSSPPSDLQINPLEVVTTSEISDNLCTSTDENTNTQSTSENRRNEKYDPNSQDYFCNKIITTTSPSDIKIEPIEGATEAHSNNLYTSMFEDTSEERLGLNTRTKSHGETESCNNGMCSINSESKVDNPERDESHCLETLGILKHTDATNNGIVALDINKEEMKVSGGNEFETSSKYSENEERMYIEYIRDKNEFELSNDYGGTEMEISVSGNTCGSTLKNSEPYPRYIVKNFNADKEIIKRCKMQKCRRLGTKCSTVCSTHSNDINLLPEQSIPQTAYQSTHQVANIQSGYGEYVGSIPQTAFQPDVHGVVKSDQKLPTKAKPLKASPMTPAERRRLYRKRIVSDPVLWEEYKAKDRERQKRKRAHKTEGNNI